MKDLISVYCHPREYTSEDIEFRKLAAETMAQYKLSQALTLKEVYDNGVHEFSETSRELISFYYDAWSQYMYSVEQIYLHHIGKSNEDLIKLTQRLIHNMREYILKTLKDNPQFFDENFIDIWMQVIPIYKSIYQNLLKSKLSKNFNKIDFYKKSSSILITLLHSLLFIVHEIDHLLYTYDGTFFLSYDEPCKIYREYTDRCMVTDKLQRYLQTSISDKLKFADKIYIKKYIDEDIDPKCLDDIFNNKILQSKKIIIK